MTLYVVERGVKKVCDILFRAKAINRDKGYHKTKYKNGDWVYGLVTRLYDERFENLPAEMTDINGVSGIEVDYKTIGQFTGLTDKNGKRIFEGDICKFKRFNDVHIGKVVFNVTTASFIMWYQPIVGAYGEKATQKMLLSVCDNIEVVGNIHDNPELLENSSP